MLRSIFAFAYHLFSSSFVFVECATRLQAVNVHRKGRKAEGKHLFNMIINFRKMQIFHHLLLCVRTAQVNGMNSEHTYADFTIQRVRKQNSRSC